MAPTNPFRLVPGVRYGIRSTAAAESEWQQGRTIQLTFMGVGHGVVPVTVRIQLTTVKYFAVTETYEFHGCVTGTAQVVTGVYTPKSHSLGTIRSPRS